MVPLLDDAIGINSEGLFGNVGQPDCAKRSTYLVYDFVDLIVELPFQANLTGWIERIVLLAAFTKGDEQLVNAYTSRLVIGMSQRRD